MSEKTFESNFRRHPTKKPKILTIGVKSQLVEEKSFRQTPLDRNLTILLYLKKHDGEWKNTNEIATYSGGHGLQRKRLEGVLDGLVEKGLFDKQPAENPQAKFEYKISDAGKETLRKYLILLDDPAMKFVAGIKREKFDELD